MTTLSFHYRARDSKGQVIAGMIDAANRTEALRRLEREGKTVTDLDTARAPSRAAGATQPAITSKHAPIAPDRSTSARAESGGGVKRDEVISFASQLSVMLETGVPLADALDAVHQAGKQGPLRRVLSVVADRIHAGAPFSAAIRDFPRVFPSLMVTLMEASEASGKMSMMLGRVADYLGKERRTSRQIRGALTYPSVMILIAVSVTVFLVAWVLPRFARIYESREAALPPLTTFVLGVSRLLADYWWAIVLGVAGAIVGYVAARATTRGRRAIDWLKLRVPVIGPMMRKYYLTRATRTLGTLLAAGVPLLESIRIVRNVTRNAHWTDLWTRIEQVMTVGGTIQDAIKGSWLIPAPIAQMISAGERTARLPEVLDRVASTSEADLDEAVKQGTQLIEPAMIVFMGVTVGGIAIALLLPIFNVANVMAK